MCWIFKRSGNMAAKSLNLKILLILGLWISNTIIGCSALPHPAAKEAATDGVDDNYDTFSQAPHIAPDWGEATLEPGTDFTFRCVSDEPIVWYKSYQLPADTFDTNETKRPHGLALHFNDIDYTAVGAYYCIKESALHADLLEEDAVELVNNNKAATVYVYVNDKEHLLAPVDIPVIQAHQYADITVPCKPTMPDVEVLLTAAHEETYSSVNAPRYNPRRGFVLTVTKLEAGGDIYCRPKVPSIDNEYEEQMMQIIITGNEKNDTKTTSIEKPRITSDSKGHVHIGGTFTLNCELTTQREVNYITDWTLPETVDKSRVFIKPALFLEGNKNGTHIPGRTTVTVRNVSADDQGIYKCGVRDHSNNYAQTHYTMTVLKPNETYVELIEPNHRYVLKQRANQTAHIQIFYRGYPEPTVSWYNPDGQPVWPNEHFQLNFTETSTTLKIMSAQMVDSGRYLLRATNGLNTKELGVTVRIEDKPIVHIGEDTYVEREHKAHLTCHVMSIPAPDAVVWEFMPCKITPRWPSCDLKIKQRFNSTSNKSMGESGLHFIHELKFVPKSPGVMACRAENTIGHSSATAHVFVGDIKENMTIYGHDERQKIGRGDAINLTCAALAYFYTADLDWYLDGDLVTESKFVTIKNTKTDYSYHKTLVFKSVSDENQGSYECRARHVLDHDAYDSRDFNIFVHEPLMPTFKTTNLDPNTKIERNLGDTLDLECKTLAIPRADVRWYKDDVLIEASNHTYLLEDNSRLLIPHLYPDNVGVYKCIAVNRLGSIESYSTVHIANLPGIKSSWIMFVTFFFLLLIMLCVYLGLRVHRERMLLRELKAAGLANFEEGAVSHINPALTLDEQADLLPYDRNFEFPREKLTLGKQLGAGAFGVVLKGHAQGIRPEEQETVVAVKMVKRTADNEVVRALVSELKIMVHLGQHLNVVNLLGAVTKNIVKRELMVIVEYCRFGNLQNFLLRNRKCFINQINKETGKIDATIIAQRFSDNFESNRNSGQDPRPGTRAGRPGSTGGYARNSGNSEALYERQVNTCGTEQTQMTTLSGEDDNILSNNSVQPAWRSNYKPDSTEAMTVTTLDLISWAYQVARGMDYLSSKKVLHGDLAARNILLCENNVVKICDFGLARSMYRGDNYKKQGDARLPIKWLALESLGDHVFSTYTDVWSFGIVLWEFFSLAKVPYPGLNENDNLYVKLRDGYRMEQPPYANEELYDIMLECWRACAERRPLFHELEKRFARMLGDDTTKHYMDLDEPYLRQNSEYQARRQTDYLALMGAPDEPAPAPPRYINGHHHIVPEIHAEAACEEQPAPEKREKSLIAPKAIMEESSSLGEDTSPEEIPMLPQLPIAQAAHPVKPGRSISNILKQLHASSSAAAGASPPTPSPRHHIETRLNGAADDAADGYVNVKPPRKINGRTDAYSNPSYQPVKTTTTTTTAGSSNGQRAT